ncbi:MAG: PEP-CTERM sorting domain-containing protein [Jaaginema sp. PMC 1078.18]|nr:PEP-CTERM sorting domain-containing protein [Jaaginema sp. PMC 1078.18]
MNRTLTLTLLTSTAVAVCGEVAYAATLFQDRLSVQKKTVTWISPVSGTVSVLGSLAQPSQTSRVVANCLFTGKDLCDIEGRYKANGATSLIDTLATVDVSVGSEIEFLVNPDNNNWSGTFDVLVQLIDSSGITLPLNPKNPPPSLDSGLVFLGRDSQTFDHVGLMRNSSKIYEASPAYQGGQYYDFIDNNLVTINQDSGVQQEHTLGSFLHLSSDPALTSSPVQNREVVKIPSVYGQDVLKDMEDFIITQLNKGYAPTDRHQASLSPVKQKGQSSEGFYTGIGLIERAAEEAGVRGKQGFIPNSKEFIKVNDIIAGPTLDALPWECLEVFPTTVDCLERGNRNPNSPFELSLLSADYLHYAIKNGMGNSESWLQGWFNNIDFMLTDPLGRRLGYTEELGFLNEITYTNEDGKEVEAYYTGDAVTEHFFIPERLEGRYLIEFYGLCNDGAVAVVGDNEDGTMIQGCKEKEAPDKIPEPGAVLGLFLLGLLGIFTRQKCKA